MAITIELWEDSGPLTAGHGTTRQAVNNLGWKDSDADETTEFVDYPIERPPNEGSPAQHTLSYTKYYYYKIYGTYDYAHQFSVSLSGVLEKVGAVLGDGYATDLDVLYKLTNTYVAPSNILLPGATIWTGQSWTPKLSTVGPQNATASVPVLAADTTYYSEYIVTQLKAYSGEWDNFGNLDDNFELHASLVERKSGLPGYDPAYITWE